MDALCTRYEKMGEEKKGANEIKPEAEIINHHLNYAWASC